MLMFELDTTKTKNDIKQRDEKISDDSPDNSGLTIDTFCKQSNEAHEDRKVKVADKMYYMPNVADDVEEDAEVVAAAAEKAAVPAAACRHEHRVTNFDFERHQVQCPSLYGLQMLAERCIQSVYQPFS